jgi:hypothetical protein
MKVYARLRFNKAVWERIVNDVEKLGADAVDAGVVGDDANRIHPSRGVTVGQVMLWNEFGARNHQGDRVPARRPLRHTFRPENPVLAEMARGVAERVVLMGQSASSALNWMGTKAVDAIRVSLAKGLPPQNAPRTIRAKGFNHPLIATGLLWEAISHRISRWGSNP